MLKKVFNPTVFWGRGPSPPLGEPYPIFLLPLHKLFEMDISFDLIRLNLIPLPQVNPNLSFQKKIWPNFFFSNNFFWPTLCWTKFFLSFFFSFNFFLAKSFFGPKFLWTNIFLTNFFFEQQFLLTNNLLDQILFVIFFLIQFFLAKSFFGQNLFLSCELSWALSLAHLSPSFSPIKMS